MLITPTMSPMTEVHETVQRLYAAAQELRDVSGPSAVARLLDVSPQVMKNWEGRGISEGGALKAQKEIGCDANWLLTGGHTRMLKDTWEPASAGKVSDHPPPRIERATSWPFETFTAADFNLLDPGYRRSIEDQLLGAITRIKQLQTAPSKAA